MSKTAAIVGAGIGGLAVAIGLSRAGWQVDVCERASGPVLSGTALGLWPSALRALDVLGVGDDLRRVATPQSSGAVLRPDGSRIATIDVERLRRRTGDPVYLMSRPALLGLLAAAVPGGAVRYGVDVRDVNALQAERDVVVGADGMFSTVRTAVVGSAYQARPTGQTAWRGTVPIHTHASTETWGAGRRFGITPHERGMTNWYATVTDPGCDGDVAELRRLFGRWHDPIPQILAELTEEAILRHELYQVFPPLPTFTNGSVVLLGDAAHAMTPDLGRGACEALVDAVTLTECLTGTPSVRSALNRYDRIRRRRTQRLAAMSLRMSRVACARRFLWLRDAVVRAATVLGPPA